MSELNCKANSELDDQQQQRSNKQLLRSEPILVTYRPFNIDNWLRIILLLIKESVNTGDVGTFRNYTNNTAQMHIRDFTTIHYINQLALLDSRYSQ